MKLTFIGHGYVGLVTAAVFADLGNAVSVIGRNAQKIKNLKKGIIPFFEPGLSELVKENLHAKRLSFTLSYTPCIPESDIVFIAVGTPAKENGEADLSIVFEVAEKVGRNLNGYTVLATKSTVPVGTNRKIKALIERIKPEKAECDVASVPEFLREGSAIGDTLAPDRIVLGTEKKRAESLLVELHKPINSRFVLCSLETAEMIKYAANSFLATKISFANTIAKLSELSGADGIQVLEGMGLDKRIGSEFLKPGIGYGGSCFPKDVKALISIAKHFGKRFALLEEVEHINMEARFDVVLKTEKLLGNLKGKKIAILGLSFKPNTDDVRDAPSFDIIEAFRRKGADVCAYDPKAMDNAKGLLKEVAFAGSIYKSVDGADALVVVTDWNEFKELDFSEVKKLMRRPIVIDGRNIYNPNRLKALGFIYQGVGR